jgi:nitrate reductase NapE component
MFMLRRPARLAMLGIGALSAPLPALAHIKWFHNYNLLVPPRGIEEVVAGTGFMPLLMTAALVLTAVSLTDSRLIGNHMFLVRVGAQIDRWTEARTYLFLRVLIALLFAVLAHDGHTLLTPELAASSPCVATIQWLIAFTALIPATGAVAGTAILVLYGMAIEKYGLFHLLDYPAFIGAAIYLIWMGQDRRNEVRAMALLRVATALTLMVGATEKFGYPSWSFQMLRDYPMLRFGVDNLDFYMAAAGVVEFALAFLLLFGRVSANVASGLLFVLMAAAIALFGWIDAVGHALFLAALLALTLRHNPVAEVLHRKTSQRPWLQAVGCATLFVVLALGFIQAYQWTYLHLTLCSVSPAGQHQHR